MSILLTGGCGYIGSHTAYEILANSNFQDYNLVIVDNLCNSSMENIHYLQSIFPNRIHVYQFSLLDPYLLHGSFRKHDIKAVIHFAGLKAVGESNQIPLKYYTNNLDSTFQLLEIMENYQCNNIIFSSSATVYGEPEYIPIDEKHRLQATNPYGRTKLMIEEILKDVYKAPTSTLNAIILRYFNPISCHPNGHLKENPKGMPNNLFPIVSRVYQGILPKVSVYGKDYSTKDGTGVRDYIHVVDLARAHVKALEKIFQHSTENRICETYNVGTGNGYSVLEMIEMFEKVTNEKINYEICERREGDVASCYADSTKVERELDWKAEYGLEDMVVHEVNRIRMERENKNQK